jgi:hypothetical protein
MKCSIGCLSSLRLLLLGLVCCSAVPLGAELAQSRGAQLPSSAGAPRLVFAFELHVAVGPPMEIGEVTHGRRRIVPILGGTFEGPRLKGKVLPGGADWQMIQPDGFSELDTRYALETDTGKIIYVQNAGIRHAAPDVMLRLLAGQPVDPTLVYFRSVPRFETSAPELQWLTRAVFVGTGERFPTEVVIRFWRLE